MVLSVSLLLAACTRLGVPEGWPAAVVEGDTIYVGTMDGDFRAIDLETGATIWNYDLKGDEGQGSAYGPPAIYDGNIYFAGYDGMLYALTQNGDVDWGPREVGNQSPIVGGPAAADGLVLVGSSDGSLYAFDSEDGLKKWDFRTGNRVWSTPTIANGVVYFGSLDHNVYALSLEDGEEMWRFSTGGGITGKPLVSGGKVYIGAFDSAFYAIDAETGGLAWKFDGAESWFWAGAAAGEGQVFAPSLDGSVYALDAETGDLMWRFEGAKGPIIGTPSGTPAILSTNREPPSKLRILQLCERVRLKRPQLWAVSPAAYWSRDPGLSGDLEIGDYLNIITLEPNDDGLIQIQVSTHDSRKLEGIGDEATVWIEWGRIEAADSIDSVFECEGAAAPPNNAAAAVSEDTLPLARMPDASKFRRLAVGSADGNVWLIDLSNTADANKCAIGKPIKSPVTAHGDMLIVSSTDHSIRALTVTASGVDEKWAHYSNQENPLATEKGKAC